MVLVWGWSCSIDYMELPTNAILPVIESDDHYDDDKERCEFLWQSKVLVMNADTPLIEYVTDILDTQSAELILCGKDKQKLEQISEKLFWDTTIVAGKDDEEIISQLDEEDVTAVIGLTGEDGIEDLMKKGILKEDASIILLDKEEKKMPTVKCKISGSQNLFPCV